MSKPSGSKKPAIFFDLDGTLIDSSLDIVNAANQARKELGLLELPHQEIVQAVGDGVRAFVEKVFCPQSSPDFKVASATFLRTYEKFATQKTKPYAGILDLLENLHEREIPMAIISNKPAKMVQEIVKHFGWQSFFPVAFGGDSLERAKPDPLPLKTAFESLSLTENHQAFMVGDGTQDLIAAAKFGIPSIWVSWGFNRELSHKPSFQVNQPSEIVEICIKA